MHLLGALLVRCIRAFPRSSHAPLSPIPSLQIGNLTNFVAYAGSCNIIPGFFGGPGGPSQAGALAAGVALDVCTPSGITVALFQNEFTNEWNSGIFPCTNSRAATVNLALDGQCVQVLSSPCPVCGPALQFWKLREISCDPPVPSGANTGVFFFRQFTGTCPFVPGNNFFQEREIIMGGCALNNSWSGGSPTNFPFFGESSIAATSQGSAYNLALYNNMPRSIDNGAVSVGCTGPVHYSFPNLPVTDANSPVCTNSVTPPGSGNTQTFGARIYRAPPYTTSRVPFTPSPNPAAAPAAAATAPDTTGVAVGSVGIVIAVLAVSAMGLMYWRMTSQISTMTTPRPGVADWASKSGQLTGASAAQGSVNPATFLPGTVHQ